MTKQFCCNIFLVLLVVLSFASCDSQEPEEVEIEFNVEVKSIDSGSAVVCITHNGTNRNTYVGYSVFGEVANIGENIQRYLDLINESVLESKKMNQRKKVVTEDGLRSNSTYTYIVFGIDENNNVYGKPAKVEFTTLGHSFTAEESTYWDISYKGATVYDDMYYSKITVNKIVEVDERYILTVYEDWAIDYYGTTEDFITAMIKQYEGIKNTDNDDKFWLENNATIYTGSWNFYRKLSVGTYRAYAIGVDAQGNPTGHYSRTEPFYVEEYPEDPAYSNLIGKWRMTDATNKYTDVTITRAIKNKTLMLNGLPTSKCQLDVKYTSSHSITISHQLVDSAFSCMINDRVQLTDLYVTGWYVNSDGIQQYSSVNSMAKLTKTDSGYEINANFITIDASGEEYETTKGWVFEIFTKEGGHYNLVNSIWTFPIKVSK